MNFSTKKSFIDLVFNEKMNLNKIQTNFYYIIKTYSKFLIIVLKFDSIVKRL
jgi:hypothetical protein